MDCNGSNLTDLAKGEGKALSAGIEELDRECALANGALLPYELVESLSLDRAVSGVVDVRAMIASGWLAVDRDAEPDRSARSGRAEHKVDVAGMEPVDDAGPGGL